MTDAIDDVIRRAIAASNSPGDAARLIREALDRAGYVITKRPDIAHDPHGRLPVFLASER